MHFLLFVTCCSLLFHCRLLTDSCTLPIRCTVIAHCILCHLHPCCSLVACCTLVALCTLHTCCHFLSYILRSVCTHFFPLVLVINAFTHSLVPAPCSTAPLVLLLGINFPPMCCSFFIFIPHFAHAFHPLFGTLITTFIHLVTPSSSCYSHHHHPHYISSFSSPSLHFFPSPFLHSPFLLYFIIHIWHHLRLAFFCNIMVICSFCVT